MRRPISSFFVFNGQDNKIADERIQKEKRSRQKPAAKLPKGFAYINAAIYAIAAVSRRHRHVPAPINAQHRRFDGV
jgi:hypothetical protein